MKHTRVMGLVALCGTPEWEGASARAFRCRGPGAVDGMREDRGGTMPRGPKQTVTSTYSIAVHIPSSEDFGFIIFSLGIAQADSK